MCISDWSSYVFSSDLIADACRAAIIGPMTSAQTYVLGAPYTAESIELPDDDEGRVVATLVHRPSEGPSRGAVLHVHGFADYFFQTEFAQWWVDRGYDFYALDLRKYGRSLLEHQTPHYIDDVGDYYPELEIGKSVV